MSRSPDKLNRIPDRFVVQRAWSSPYLNAILSGDDGRRRKRLSVANCWWLQENSLAKGKRINGRIKIS
jgi:hypothetical protein